MRGEYLSAFDHYIRQLMETSVIKTIFAIILWIIHVLFGPTIRPALIAILTLCVLDFITGALAAWLNPHDHVHSRRIRLSIIKILLYLIVVAVARQISILTGPGVGPFFQGFLEALAGGTEALSVLENADRIGKYTGREIPWLQRIIRVIRGRQEKALTALEGGDEPDANHS